MSTFARAGYVRFATLVAIALVLLLSGVVVGAAGGPLIMGAANDAQTSNTSLVTNSTGTALLVTQTSTGTALRGVATNGIAGFFTSANGSGVSGVVAANTKYGVFGANDAAAFGGGAAIRASGQQNHGVVATTANAAADALRGVNTGGGQGLDLVVNSGVAPMTVNSDTKVVNLNADLLDGVDASGFLPAGDYTVMQLGPWHVRGTDSVTIGYFVNSNDVVAASPGGRAVQLALDGPAAVGGIGYRFASARICFLASANVTIADTNVYQATDTSWLELVLDTTDRSMAADACYTVSDGTPTVALGGTTLQLALNFAAASTATLMSVTTTWTPVSL